MGYISEGKYSVKGKRMRKEFVPSLQYTYTVSCCSKGKNSGKDYTNPASGSQSDC